MNLPNDDQGWIHPDAPHQNWLHPMGMASPSSVEDTCSDRQSPSPLAAAASPAAAAAGEGSPPTTSKKRKYATFKLPPMADIVSWPELIQHHAALVANKDNMCGRRFNKTALELLDACVRLVQSGGGGGGLATPSFSSSSSSSPAPAKPNPTLDVAERDWASQKEALVEFRSLLLNHKEVVGEDLVQRVVEYIQQTLPPLLTADEKRETLLKKSMSFMQELSPALCLKTAPLVKSCVAKLFDSHMDQMFAEITLPDMDLKEKALIYRRMLSNFIDDERCVSFAATNRHLLGKLLPKDVWFLTFFACVTARRSRGDNLLQLGCVGE